MYQLFVRKRFETILFVNGCETKNNSSIPLDSNTNQIISYSYNILLSSFWWIYGIFKFFVMFMNYEAPDENSLSPLVTCNVFELTALKDQCKIKIQSSSKIQAIEGCSVYFEKSVKRTNKKMLRRWLISLSFPLFFICLILLLFGITVLLSTTLYYVSIPIALFAIIGMIFIIHRIKALHSHYSVYQESLRPETLDQLLGKWPKA